MGKIPQKWEVYYRGCYTSHSGAVQESYAKNTKKSFRTINRWVAEEGPGSIMQINTKKDNRG